MLPKRRKILVQGATAAVASQYRWARASHASLKFALTPVILADQLAFLTRWSRYLGEKLGVPVEFVARESYQSVLDLLYGGQVDAAWICGYPFIREQARFELLSVPIYQGQPTYQAYLISSTVSKARVSGWSDLRGKVLAFSDPLSNSGWLVAQAQMSKAGIRPEQLKRSFFTYGHRNVAEAVGLGLADAGSIDGYVWETLRAQGFEFIKQTRVVWKSEPFGFPPIVALRTAKHPALGKLKQALFAMQQDATGRELLASLNLAGFGSGESALFDSIRKQAEQLSLKRV